MKIWPSDSFDICTAMSLDEVVRTVDSFVGFQGGRPFEGKHSREGFKISRIIHYRNSSLPVVIGSYETNGSGTIVHVEMRLAHWVSCFIGLVLGFVLFGFIGILSLVVNGRESFHPAMLIPLVMIISIIAMPWLWFWFEAKKQRPLLESLLRGQIRNDKAQ